MYCRSCFTNLPDTAETCRKCGRDPRVVPAAPVATTRLAPTPPIPPAAPDDEPSPHRRWVAVVGLGLALAAAASAVVVLVARPGSDGPAQRASAQSAEEAVLAVAVPVDLEPPALPEAADPDALGEAGELYRDAMEARRRGDLAGAVGLLREASIASGAPAVEAGLTNALESLAAERLRAGALAEAEVLLAEAVERDAERGTAWKALGYVQLRQDRPAEASASLAEAVRLLPDDGQTRLLYGTALYRSGDSAGALVQLRAGRDAARGDPAFEALLARIEREAKAEQGFTRAESRHFVVSFEGGGTSEQAGYLVSLLLEDAYHQVGSRLDYYPTEPVHAVLYPAEQFRDVTRSPDWAGAIFDGKIRLPVGGLTDRTDALARTIAHEYTHALVHRLARGRAPTWLNEGLAQLSEGPVDPATRERWRAYVRAGGGVRSLASLEGPFVRLGASEARLAYMQSLAATDFLVTQYGAPASRRILERLAEGADVATAIGDVLYVSYEEFDRQWLESYR